MDYKGKEVKYVDVNGTRIKGNDYFYDHKIHLPQELLKPGQNKVTVRFVSNYVRDCQGLHYFKDSDDQEEYLYSQFEAADAHKCFPCFD